HQQHLDHRSEYRRSLGRCQLWPDLHGLHDALQQLWVDGDQWIYGGRKPFELPGQPIPGQFHLERSRFLRPSDTARADYSAEPKPAQSWLSDLDWHSLYPRIVA